jgi:hypothetical protein
VTPGPGGRFDPGKGGRGFALGFVDSGPQDLYGYASRKERRPTMPAYFVVQATIKDEPQYQKYREAVVPFMVSRRLNASEGGTDVRK